MWSKKFALDLIERTISTMAVTAGSVLAGTALVQQVNWAVVGGATALAGIATVLKGLAASRTGDPDSAGFGQ